MSDYFDNRRNSPHLLGQKNRTVYFGDKAQAGLMKQDELKTDLSKMENAVSFEMDSKNGNGFKQQASVATENQNIRRLYKNNNRIYYECLNVAERILTRYISARNKPLRFLNLFADALFEKRTKQSIEAYHEFLDTKISELQRRNRPHQALKLTLKNYERPNESCWR
ncbi:MAG: hypothetical protein ABSF88_09095 [Candidatus Aminicenantales bacterium]